MSVLDKLNETIEAMQDFKAIQNANDLVEYFKETYRGKLGEALFKCDFDKSEYGNGIVFIRYARCPYNEATNEVAMESDLNFVIAVEGFDASGGLCDECGEFRAQMLMARLPDGVKKMRQAAHPDIEYIKNYATKYLDLYSEAVCNEEAPAVGVPGNGVTVGGNPVSASNLTGTENIAVYKQKLGGKKKKPERRGKQ